MEKRKNYHIDQKIEDWKPLYDESPIDDENNYMKRIEYHLCINHHFAG